WESWILGTRSVAIERTIPFGRQVVCADGQRRGGARIEVSNVQVSGQRAEMITVSVDVHGKIGAVTDDLQVVALADHVHRHRWRGWDLIVLSPRGGSCIVVGRTIGAVGEVFIEEGGTLIIVGAAAIGRVVGKLDGLPVAAADAAVVNGEP